MVCKAMMATLSIAATAVTVDASEGLSLLQTHAHLHTQMDLLAKDPKSKSQSSMSGNVDITKGEVDFDCMDGAGKWVYMNVKYKEAGLIPTHTELNHAIVASENRLKNDLSVNTTNIIAFYNFQGGIRGRSRVTPDGKAADITYTTHRPVKNEKDCFARAKQDYWCRHYAEDVVFGGTGWKSPPVMGVWYGGSGWGPGVGMDAVKKDEGFEGSSTSCMCGPIDVKGLFPYKGQSYQVEVGNKDKPGMWFCKYFNNNDELVTEAEYAEIEEQASNPVKEPREKKTPEEKAACAEAKEDAKASRAALKALRAKLKEARAAVKALKAQIKAAKEDLAEKKAALC